MMSEPHPLPIISHVFDLNCAAADCCTPGDRFVIRGRGFGDWDDVPLDMGIYVHFANGLHLQRVDEYESWQDGEVRARWPRWIVGPFRLFIETRASCGLIVSAVHPAPVRVCSSR